MPASLTIIAGVTVAATPERVWELALDWHRQREWIWATRTEGGSGVGATVTAWTGVGPVGFTDTMVITEWDPPRRCVVRHAGKLVRGTAMFEVFPRGARAEFRWTERIVLTPPLPAPLARLAVPVIAQVARAGLGSSLLRFAWLVEPGRRADRSLVARVRMAGARRDS